MLSRWLPSALQQEGFAVVSYALRNLVIEPCDQAAFACAVFHRHFAKGKSKGGPVKKKSTIKLSRAPDGQKVARDNALAVVKKEAAASSKLDSLTGEERAVYEAIAGVPAEKNKLSTQRLIQRVAYPWSEDEVASLIHQNLSNQAGGIGVYMQPLEIRNIFQSAEVVADYVADMLMSDMNWGKVQRLFTQLLSSNESTFVRGIKIQIKGRLSVKAGKAASKEWQYGHTSMATFSDAVDYSEKTALTRAGYIGVKVWIRYHKEAFPVLAANAEQSGRVRIEELLQVPRTWLPSRSITAWWNRPGTLQPFINQTWDAVKSRPQAPAAS